MRRWTDFPQDNADRQVRQWVGRKLSGSGLAIWADERECRQAADRIMAGVDDRSRVILEALDRRYDEGELNRIAACLDQVLEGMPVQHAVGWTEFRGLRIACGPEALIPRPETEEVVGWWLEGMAEIGRDRREVGPVRVLDVGTGTGCMALAIKAERPHWEVWALDADPGALALARSNGAALGLEVHWVLGDALEADWPSLSSDWDGIISNPPYIPQSEEAELAPHVREREPHKALFVPDGDPLLFYRALAREAPRYLRKAGCMVAECHAQFTREVADCWQLEGARTEVLIDLQGAERAVRLIRQ